MLAMKLEKYRSPMIRKEVKAYGGTKMIEGSFEKGETVLLVEDVISSGSSIVETAEVQIFPLQHYNAGFQHFAALK